MLVSTERLTVRPMQRSDVPFLVKLWSDPEVTRYLGGPRETSWLLEEFEQDLRKATPETFDLWPVVEKATNRLVGHCGLLDKEVDGRLEIDLVYVFERPAQGNGYATETARALAEYAREQLRLRRLVALIDPENVASARVAVKTGMSLERETSRPNGRVVRVYAVNYD